MNRAATALKAAVGALCAARSQAASGQLMSMEPAPVDVPLEGFTWIAIAAKAAASIVLTVGSLYWLGRSSDPFETSLLDAAVLWFDRCVITPLYHWFGEYAGRPQPPATLPSGDIAISTCDIDEDPPDADEERGLLIVSNVATQSQTTYSSVRHFGNPSSPQARFGGYNAYYGAVEVAAMRVKPTFARRLSPIGSA